VVLDDLNNITGEVRKRRHRFLRDVGYVRDGRLVQQNRGAHGGAPFGLAQHHQERQRSTVAVVNAVKDALTRRARRRLRGSKITEFVRPVDIRQRNRSTACCAKARLRRL